MKTTLKWIDGVCFMAETGSGHAVVMDGAPEGGGRNLGPRPMERYCWPALRVVPAMM